MGLDAFVRCRCWQDELTTEPPVPRELITEDGAGYLDLSLPYDGNEDVYGAFDAWLHDGACPHEDMEIVAVGLSNWSGYRQFQDALRTAGGAGFPTLEAELPERNGGEMSASRARLALDELRRFTEEARLGTETVLVNEDTGARLATHVRAHDGVFTWDGRRGRRVGVDPEGLFVLDARDEPGRELFRAPRCVHEPAGPGPGGGVLVRLTDPGTGREAVVDLGHPIVDDTSPVRLAVVEEPVSPRTFAYIVDPLARACRAAVETGNPVVWT